MPLSPPDIVRQLSLAAYLGRAFQTIAELGVADHVSEAPTEVAAIADKMDLNADALLRVLRLLSVNGVFLVEGEMVSHTPASQLLRTDNPRSMRALPLLYGTPEFWAPLANFSSSLKSGKAVSDQYPELELWECLKKNPQSGRIFDAAMTSRAHAQVAATVANYDFSTTKVIGDIGGGRGHLVRAVLDQNPGSKGVIFDLPGVVADVVNLASDRLSVQGGDFFKDTLPACDLYMVMEVIHDWGDAESRAILSAIRKSAPPNARLLLIERIMTTDNEVAFVKSIDIVMLTLLGGKQRNQVEYEQLLSATGWKLSKVINTESGLSLIESTAV